MSALYEPPNKVFHHGGRLGDCIFALYTAWKLGGGKFYLSLFHTPAWNQEMANSLLPLIKEQRYITEVGMCEPPPRFGDVEITHDLHQAECDFNPEDFPEWEGPPWPGNCNIRKRYAVHFGVDFQWEDPWLTAPKTREGEVDIVFHMPHRRSVRSPDAWIKILLGLQRGGYKVKVLAGKNDAQEWRELTNQLDVIIPVDMLETANYINSCKIFMGGASSCNAIAEGLGKRRLVELAPDCYDVYAKGRMGRTINRWTDVDIVWVIQELMQQEARRAQRS